MKKLFFLSFCLAAVACKPDRISSNDIAPNFKVVSVLNATGHGDLEQPLFRDLELVFLETNDDILLANCDKVIFHEDRFYVYDSQFSHLLAFDRQGKYLFRVGNLGHGPGEYQSIYGFSVDTNADKILVYSLDNQAVFEYSLEGRFIEKKGVDFYGHDFDLAPNGDYIFNLRYNDNGLYAKDNVFVTNRQGKVNTQLFPYPQTATKMVIGFSGFLCIEDDLGYYAHTFSDTIYRVDWNTQKVQALFKLDLGSKHWPHGLDFNKFDDKDFLQYNYLSERAFVRDDLLFFGFLESERFAGGAKLGQTPKTGILNMTNGELLTTNNAANEFLLMYDFGIPKGRMTDGRLITSMGANEIGLIRRNYPESWNAALNNYSEVAVDLGDLKEENNPVLLLYNVSK